MEKQLVLQGTVSNLPKEVKRSNNFPVQVGDEFLPGKP